MELNNKGAYVEGKTGEFIKPGPIDMGCNEELSASICNREILW